jgi:hypothetical protein
MSDTDVHVSVHPPTIQGVIDHLKEELEIQERFQGHTRHFSMGTWASNLLDSDKLHDPTVNPNLCNTAACLAGTASLLWKLSQGEDIFTWVEPGNDEYVTLKGYWQLMDEDDMYNLGRDILGFNDTEADAFFYSNWPHTWLREQGIEHHTKTYELEGAIKLLELKRDGRLRITEDGEQDWVIDEVNVTAEPDIDMDEDDHEDEEPDDEDLDTGDEA